MEAVDESATGSVNLFGRSRSFSWKVGDLRQSSYFVSR
jgi:hypothetical protein